MNGRQFKEAQLSDWVLDSEPLAGEMPTSPRCGRDTHPPGGRVAGIDYGTVRIGIALSDPDRTVAFPYEIFQPKSPKHNADYFLRLVVEERITGFALGLPLHLSGDLSEKAKEVLKFGSWLQDLTGVAVDYVDERYTSVEAEQVLRAAKLTEKKRKARRDKIAAQIILSSYLESGCKGISTLRR